MTYKTINFVQIRSVVSRQFFWKKGFSLIYVESDFYPDGTSAIYPTHCRRHIFSVFKDDLLIGHIACGDGASPMQSRINENGI